MFLGKILGPVMNWCYQLISNYGWAIILFTLFSKFVLLPVSVWVQKNSIKMVKMQPAVNKIKINHFGDKDAIADEQSKLYKKEKYNAFASLIPMLIQIILLIGLVEVINHPLTYIAKMDKANTSALVQVALDNNEKLDEGSSSLEIAVVDDIQNGRFTDEYTAAAASGDTLAASEMIDSIKGLKMNFCGLNLGWVATTTGGIAWLVPLIAGFSAFLLCVAQNSINVLQAEQSKLNKYGMMAFSVGLSLYLGMFVPAGVALYWTASNLFAILQQWLLNIAINPKKHVDYAELEKTRKELLELNNMKSVKALSPEAKKKAKADYKSFFHIVNKHLVFYSESSGFYKYYKGIIEYILAHTNITIHYITSDFNDNIFELEKQNPKIKAYFIDEKRLITLMMKMDADVVAMTMPDLETYHIKRSYIRKDIEYVYIPHGMDSNNMAFRTKALNAFDTVYVCGPHQLEECEKIAKLYDLKDQKFVNYGYCLLDAMIADYESAPHPENEVKTVLIAPSWQKDNIIDLCLDDVMKSMRGKDYRVIVRPHPQHVRHAPEKFERLKEQYKDDGNITIQTDFSSNDTVFNADILITDWSSISQDYAFTTKKPVIFIDTPPKIMNPEYKRIDTEPINIWIRNEVGTLVKLDELDKLDDIVREMLANREKYREKIAALTERCVYNLGTSSEVGAKYIIEAIQEKIKKRKETQV